MLQTSDTIECRGISVMPLPFDLMNSTLDIAKPSAEDLAVVHAAGTLAHAFLAAVIFRSALVGSVVACFPLAREFRIAHAQQLCAARSIRRRYSHQLADG